jgi:hypothetical protein
MCDYGDMRHTDVAAVVHARDVSWRGLAADTCSMRMRMQGGSNRVEDIRADICGGSVTGSVEVVRDLEGARPPAYRVALRADALDFEALAKLWAPRDEGHRGRFTATLDLGGTVGSEAAGTARGHGFLSVREGRVFALPLFGGLSRILSRVVPGLDFVLRQSDAEAAYTVAGGVVRSEKISVKGDVLSLSGHGEYRFERRELDFHAQVHLMKEHTLVAKLLRVITYPLSKLFEFRVRGTLEEPAWYPVNFSKELLEKIRSGNAP